METVLWFPVILTILTVVADLSMMYTINADMWHVSYDTARRMSRGELSANDAPAHARAAMPGHVADSVTITAQDDGSEIELFMSAPANAVGALGLFSMISDTPVTARIKMRAEGGDEPDFSQFYGMNSGAGAPSGGA